MPRPRNDSVSSKKYPQQEDYIKAVETYLVVLRGMVSGLLLALAVRRDVVPNKGLLSLDRLLVRILQQSQAESNVVDEHVASALGEVLSHNDTQHLELLGVRRHRVRGDDPSPGAQVVRERKLVVVAVLSTLSGVLEAEGHEGQALAAALRHDDEAVALEHLGEVVGGAGQVAHDGLIAPLAEADELVVLANDLGGTLGEVEGEGGLLGAEVVDVEDEVLGEVLVGAPDDPANTGVDEAVLVFGGEVSNLGTGG